MTNADYYYQDWGGLVNFFAIQGWKIAGMGWGCELVMGPGQIFLTRVRSGWVSHLWFGFEFGNFSFASGQKKSLRVGSDSTQVGGGSASYLLWVKTSKVSSGWVGSGPISSVNAWPKILVLSQVPMTSQPGNPLATWPSIFLNTWHVREIIMLESSQRAWPDLVCLKINRKQTNYVDSHLESIKVCKGVWWRVMRIESRGQDSPDRFIPHFLTNPKL